MDRYAVLLKQYESNRLEADKLGNDYLKIKAALAGEIMSQESRDRATGVQAESNRLTASGQQLDRAGKRMLEIEAKALAYAKAAAESTGLTGPAAQTIFQQSYAAKLKELQGQVMVDPVAKPPANAKIRN
jgi:hypothetical protein